MADQKHRAVLYIDHPVGRGDVVHDRTQRVLHGDNVETLGSENRNDFRPAGAVGPGAMNEHYILDHCTSPFMWRLMQLRTACFHNATFSEDVTAAN
jgi:hypothetical protein